MNNIMFDDFVLDPVIYSSESDLESDAQSISTDSLSDNDKKDKRRNKYDSNGRDSLELSMSVSICRLTREKVTRSVVAMVGKQTNSKPEIGAERRSHLMSNQNTRNNVDMNSEDVFPINEVSTRTQNSVDGRSRITPTALLNTYASNKSKSSFFVHAGNDTPAFSQVLGNCAVKVEGESTTPATQSNTGIDSSLLTDRSLAVEPHNTRRNTIRSDYGMTVGPVPKPSLSRERTKKQNGKAIPMVGSNTREPQYLNSSHRPSKKIISNQIHAHLSDKASEAKLKPSIIASPEGREFATTIDEISLRRSLDRLDGELRRLTANIENRVATHEEEVVSKEGKSEDDSSTLLACSNGDGKTTSQVAFRSSSREKRTYTCPNAPPLLKHNLGGIRKHRLRRSKLISSDK